MTGDQIMKRKLLALALFALCALACFAKPLGAQSSQTVLHYKDVVGTYEEKITGSGITINRAPRGLLRISIGAVYPHQTANGEMTANTGEAEGTAKLVGNTAFFKPEGTEQCTLTLVFKPSRLIVTQKGTDSECGFGQNVNAGGTYKLKSRRVQANEHGAPVRRKT
jgi:hypothetical protein